MKLPRVIDVIGYKWKVKQILVVRDSDGNVVEGFCDYHKRTIAVEKNSPRKLEIFIHEWLHAVWFECGIMEELPDKYKYLEHWFITPVAKEFERHRRLFNQMTQPIKRNKSK